MHVAVVVIVLAAPLLPARAILRPARHCLRAAVVRPARYYVCAAIKRTAVLRTAVLRAAVIRAAVIRAAVLLPARYYVRAAVLRAAWHCLRAVLCAALLARLWAVGPVGRSPAPAL